jgi:putative FmdB family regulatory protein
MPRYNLRCRKCNKLFDVMIPLKMFGEKVKCPYCRKVLEMEMSAPYFVIH